MLTSAETYLTTSIQKSVTAATAVADSTTIDMRKFSQGEIIVPTGETVATLTLHTSHDDSTYVAAYDTAASPAAVTISVGAAEAHPFPSELAGAAYVRLTGNAAATVIVVKKS